MTKFSPGNIVLRHQQRAKRSTDVGLGDLFGHAATPIARAFNLPCIDPITGQLKPASRCAKRKAQLNNFSEAIFDRFWPSSKPKE